MQLQSGQRPELIDGAIFRSRDILPLIANALIKSTTPVYSEPCQVGGFRHFTLYAAIDSTGTDDHTVHVEVQFLEPTSGQWYSHKQGLFAALFWEDEDTASGIHEMFSGDCAGRECRLKITGGGVSSLLYFDVSLSMEFWG